jgi:hypothetical protein
MKNYIPVNYYKRVEEVKMNGFVCKSTYNHNFYMGFENPMDIIVEICDDIDFFEYYKINGFELGENGNILENREYLGAHEYESIFEATPNALGSVEVDTDLN